MAPFLSRSSTARSAPVFRAGRRRWHSPGCAGMVWPANIRIRCAVPGIPAMLRAHWVRRSGLQATLVWSSPISDYAETWHDLIRHPDGKIALAIPELLSELRVRANEPAQVHTDEYPFVLSAESAGPIMRIRFIEIRIGASRTGTARCAYILPMRAVSDLPPAIRHCVGRVEAPCRLKSWWMKPYSVA